MNIRLERSGGDIKICIPESHFLNLGSSANITVVPSSTPPSSSPTLKKCYETYLSTRQLRPSTITCYNRAVFIHLKEWLSLPIFDIDEVRFVTKCSELKKTVGDAQTSLTVRVFKAIHSFMAFQQKMPPTPFARALRYAGINLSPKRKNTCIPVKSLERWFSAVLSLNRNKRERTARDIFILGVLLGARKNEIMKLEWKDVDLRKNVVAFRQTKNHSDHVLPISPFLSRLLAKRRCDDKSDYVFPGKSGNTPIRDIDDMRERVIQLSSIDFTLHDLRRTFATTAVNVGLQTYTVKRLLNHRMAGDVTNGYIIYTPDDLRDPLLRIEKMLLPKNCKI